MWLPSQISDMSGGFPAWLGVAIGGLASLGAIGLVVFILLRRRPQVFLGVRRVWELGERSGDESSNRE